MAVIIPPLPVVVAAQAIEASAMGLRDVDRSKRNG